MDAGFARCLSYAIGVVLGLGAALTPASAATLPGGFTETPVASGLASPTAMQFAPDGRIFVCEQGGRLRVIKNGVLLATPFVTLTVNASGERGLLGVAFDPGFGANNYVYLYYTATTPTVHNRISRFTANGDVAQPGSEVVLLDLDTLSGATNHNGGALAFGPDGKLYAAVGENANTANAQTLSNLLGKMLRLNTDIPNTIPADNPFYTTATGRNRAIWALGLRNPFTFAFNPNGPEMFINDVGQNTWEEINDGRAGANYGWPETEGATGDPRYVSPRHAYNHSGGGCAITGGAFYSPLNARFPTDYAGDYFFADFCGGWIRRLDPNTGNTVTNFASGIASPVDMKVSDDGYLYYLARGSGATTGVLYRVDFGAGAPAITSQPASRTVAAGASVTFSASASGAAPLRYQWRRNGATIAGATAPDFTIASVAQADNGARFSVVVSNTSGSATSADAVLTVSANQAPTATIVQPVVGTTYAGGSVITYSGTGSDPEAGTLSAGATHTTQRDVLPRTVQVTLATGPVALPLRLDGQPVTAPTTFTAVVGIVRTIAAPTPQASGATTYEFVSWSDGGAASHNIATPAANTTYTATYRVVTAGTGTGLAATYYDNVNFTGATVVRTDPGVNFDWASGSPAPAIGVDTFSARWTGQVQPQFSETYTFYTQSDDGVRLWVNNVPVVNNWTDHAITENSGTIALTAGQRYDIRMEFYEAGGLATARLLWRSASTPKAAVPASRLYPSTTPPAIAITINFQPAAAPVPAGYLADGGLVYANRANGQSYGWTIVNTGQTRDRNASNSPDQRYDTLTHLQKPANPDAVWEIAVINGTYRVRIVSGDAANVDSVFRTTAEGVLVVNGTPTSSTRWIEGTQTVTVTDGRLTLRSGAGASNNKICFVDITPQ